MIIEYRLIVCVIGDYFSNDIECARCHTLSVILYDYIIIIGLYLYPLAKRGNRENKWSKILFVCII